MYQVLLCNNWLTVKTDDKSWITFQQLFEEEKNVHLKVGRFWIKVWVRKKTEKI